VPGTFVFDDEAQDRKGFEIVESDVALTSQKNTNEAIVSTADSL
jgi:hypothetical protein